MFSSNKNFFNFILINFKQKKKFKSISFFTQYESLIYSFFHTIKYNFRLYQTIFQNLEQKNLYHFFYKLAKRNKITLIQIYFVSENYNILHII
jgi:hypothetical protein